MVIHARLVGTATMVFEPSLDDHWSIGMLVAFRTNCPHQLLDLTATIESLMNRDPAYV